MNRFSCVAASLAFLTSPLMACPSMDNPSPDTLPDASFQSFHATLAEITPASYVDRFCALVPEDQTFAMQTYGSAYAGLEQSERDVLLRMSILVLDIAENVSWVAQNREIREEDDEWESIGIRRFVDHVLNRFPKTTSVLNADFLARIDTLYQSAFDAVHGEELDADRRIAATRREIAELERQQDALREKIEGMKEERLKYREMRQELDLQAQ